ncbi:hypothetical protein AHAS_Ahas02G0155700 [Arachis hypogaea]
MPLSMLPFSSTPMHNRYSHHKPLTLFSMVTFSSSDSLGTHCLSQTLRRCSLRHHSLPSLQIPNPFCHRFLLSLKRNPSSCRAELVLRPLLPLLCFESSKETLPSAELERNIASMLV